MTTGRKKTLFTLQEMNIGWGKSINEALTEYELPTDFMQIKNTPARQWERLVSLKTERMNYKRLLKDCYKIENGCQIEKTKTAHIIPCLTGDTYIRGPRDDIIQFNKYNTKTLVIARFGMLDCGTNYKGTKPEICSQCNVIDNEDHRLNNCIKYRNINQYDCNEKVNFKKIFSNDIEVLREIIPIIQRVWNCKTAHGTMAI